MRRHFLDEVTFGTILVATILQAVVGRNVIPPWIVPMN
jgi:hypothetical protein